MKRNKTKIIALSLLASLCVGAGVGLMANNTQTENTIVSAKADSYGNVLFETVDTLKMEGAAVRVSGDTSGMRFTSSISKAEYDVLASKYTVTTGMLVIPEDKLTGELSLENTTDSIKNVSTANVEELSTKGDNYEFRAVLYGIPEESFGRDVVGRGYITISDGVESVTFYTDDATRNISYVAYMASEIDEESVYYQKNNETLVNYIGDKSFYAVDLPEGVECDYTYGYAGQEIVVSVNVENATNTLTVNGAASYTQDGNNYNVVMGDSAVSVSNFAVTVDLTATPYDFDLSATATADFVDVVGSVTSITDGFTYADGVLTTTAAAGDYAVQIVTDAGYTYNLNAAVITQVISSYEEFQAARDANTVSGVWSGYYILDADYSMPTNVAYSSSATEFSGIFDGRGHTISGGFYNGSSAATGFLFAALKGTLKNTAFKDCQIAYTAGICNVSEGGLIDNCLFDGLRYANIANGNLGIIYNGVSSGTISNSIFYFPAGDGSNNDKGAITMLGSATSNVYVFSSKITGYDYRTSKTGVTLYSYTTALSSTAVSGLNEYWDLSGSKASFYSAVDTGIELDICLDANDEGYGSKYIHLTNDLGIANGTVESIVDNAGNNIPFAISGEYVVVNPACGEQTMYITVDGVQYSFEATVITQVINTAEELTAFASVQQDGGYYVLGNNIDASALTINHTGSFTGTFDGRGYVIDGVTTGKGGLFGAITVDSVVRNFAVTNAKLVAGAWDGASVMTGSGWLYGTIEDCYIELISATSTHGETYPFDGNENRTAMAVCNSLDDGYMNNVVVKVASGVVISHNVCNMLLDRQDSSVSTITNTYVIGGVTNNVGTYNENSAASVSITKVSTLTEAQQATFNSEIWGFEDGMPYFVKGLIMDWSDYTDLGSFDIEASATEISFETLGLNSVKQVYNSNQEAITELTATGINLPFGTAGESEFYYVLSEGELYRISVMSVTQIIDTTDELSVFATTTQNGGYYILGDNIDASTLTLNHTGTFTGTFDGRGYAIDGATIASTKNNGGGLFGVISAGSVVRNLAVTNASIYAHPYSHPSVMTGDGYLYGTIEDCYVELVSVASNVDGYTFTGTADLFACGLCYSVDGGVINNVVVKTVTGLSHNVTNMVLSAASITNTYVIGGGTTNSGWNRDGAPVSITQVTMLSAVQQATFNSDIWGFDNGVPYFKATRVDLTTAVVLDVTAPKIYANANEGTQEILLSDLGLSGTVEKVYDSSANELTFELTANGFIPSGVTGGQEPMYIIVDGTLYKFDLVCVSNVITTAEELSTFASAVQNGYFELGNNIDASALTINRGNTFTGTFDGCGYIIDGVTTGAGGLFGSIDANSVVKNLGVTNAKLSATAWASPSIMTGSGSLFGTIENCYVEITSVVSESGTDYPFDGNNNRYAMGVCSTINGGVIRNVVINSVSGLTYNVCNMQLGTATVSNTYVMAGASQNSGWNQGQATVSVTNVGGSTGALSSLVEAGFNTDIWTASVGNRPQFNGIDYRLTEASASEYCIIRDSDTISVEAATAIQTYFKEATGIELTILDKSEYANLTRHYISVGYTYQMQNHTGLWNIMGCGTTGEDLLGLGTTGYIVDTVEGNVFITGFYKGNNINGTLNGAYAWLNAQFGLEMYADDAYVIDTGCTDEKLEGAHTVAIPEIPAVIGGNSDSYGESSMGYYAINGGDGLIAGAYGNNIYPFHNFLGFLPQSPDKTIASNPAGVTVDLNYGELLGTALKNDFSDGYSYYYDNVYDNRCVYDLCLSQNQDVMIPYLMDRMASLIASVSAKHQKYIAFTHEDGAYWCPHCRQKFAAGGTGYATEAEYITAEYTKFMIKLANAMANDENNRFSNITLVMAHYGLASNLPVSGSEGAYTLDAGISAYMTTNGLSLPSNLAVIVSHAAVNNYAGDEDFSVVRNHIEKWKTVTNKFLIWTYIENYSNYFAPFDGLEQIQANMQFAKECGVELYYPQGMSNIGTTSIDWGAMENYVISKLMWDLDADVDALIDDFLTNYYGAAATNMKSLYASYKTKIQALHEAYGFGGTYNLLSKNGVDYISTTCWSQVELEGFLNQIKSAYTSIATAKTNGTISEAEYNALYERINVEELTFKYMYIKLYSSVAKTYYGAASVSALQTSFVEECKALGVTNFSEGQEITTSIF